MKMAIKMISFLMMIMVFGFLTACDNSQPPQNSQNPNSREIVGGGVKTANPPTAPESVSVYPLEVDPDQDNVLNVSISGHPEYPIDNCPTVFNPGQEDEDDNGIGDVCESR